MKKSPAYYMTRVSMQTELAEVAVESLTNAKASTTSLTYCLLDGFDMISRSECFVRDEGGDSPENK